ncbi:MAG TPA: DUF484 family protein [Nitrococcus sp.]|nr:DUF484 family protein [Nitrococcus sp.]
MSTQHPEAEHQVASLDEALVAEYLRRHPDFFLRQRALVAELRIPHDVRPALSLIEYQVQVLRDEGTRLRARLDELLRIARSNDRLVEQLHRLTLELLDADSLETVLDALQQNLQHSFHADTVHVILITPLSAQANASLWKPDHPDAARLAKLFQDNRPLCGRLTDEQLQLAFGERAATVKSAALIPLVDGAAQGLLAIGSHNPEHYRPDQGTLFLRQLGAMLARAIHRHLLVNRA